MPEVAVKMIQAACSAITALITKAGSRKFLVLLIATHAMYISLLPPEYWTMIVMAWQSVHGGRQMLSEYRGVPIDDYSVRRSREVPGESRYRDDPGISGIDGVAVQ